MFVQFKALQALSLPVLSVLMSAQLLGGASILCFAQIYCMHSLCAACSFFASVVLA